MATYKIKYGDTLSGIARANGTTVSELLKANPNITDPNRISAGASLNLGGTQAPSTPTPQPTSSNPKTIAEKASLIPDVPTEDPTMSAYYKEQKKLVETPIDERKLREKVRKQYESQFDSLRLVAAQKIADERKMGEGRLGSARALQARSGVLGSNFAGAENDEINRDTQDIVNSVNAETEAKIAYLMGESEKDYSAQLAKATEAKRQGAEAYLEYLKTRDSERSTKASNLAKLFATQGIDPATLTSDDIKKLETTYGVDLGSFKTMVIDAKNQINKDAFFELSDGESKYVYDPVTGEAKLIAENQKNFAPKSSSGGSGSGYGGGSGSFGSDLDAMIATVGASLNGKYKQEAFAQTISRARNDEDKIAAIASAVNITGDARQDLTQTGIGQRSLKTAIGMLKNGVQTGVIKSGANYAFNLVGGQVDPQMTQLQQYITAAIQPYRSSVTGAAWGQQEEAEYRALFGSTKDTPETLLTKLENLDRIMTNKRVGIIQSYADPLGVNSSFDSYYVDNPVNQGGGNVEQTVTVRSRDGRVIEIPQRNLEAALQAGYTQI